MRPFPAYGLLTDADTGAVDETLQATEFLQRQRYHRHAVGFRSHIGLDESRPAQFLRQGAAQVGVDVGDDDIAAGRGDDACRGRAETRRATGDDKRAVLDFHVSLPRLRMK